MSLPLRILLLILFSMICWLVGLLWFVNQMPDYEEYYNYDNHEAIIALTGGSKRVEQALSMVNQQTDAKLLISGLGKNFNWQLMQRRYGAHINIDNELKNKVYLGNWATNTALNAVESLAWVTLHDINEICIVTANYHMPRALYEFRKQMPDIKINACPVFPESFNLTKWWSGYVTISLVFLEYNKFIV
ncbi:MAG: YdcF family protein, partial [Pseudomonadota bacterium]